MYKGGARLYRIERNILITTSMVASVLGAKAYAIYDKPVIEPHLTPEEVQARAEQAAAEAERRSTAPGSVSIQYMLTAKLEGNTVYLNYTNPADSTHSVVVELYINDIYVGKSELLEPGTTLSSIKTESVPTELNGHNYLHVKFYDDNNDIALIEVDVDDLKFE